MDVVGEGAGDEAGNDEDVGDAVLVESLQPPNQSGCWQLEMDVAMGKDDVVVMVGAGAGVGLLYECEGLVVVVVVSSLQPNHPGVLHVEVEVIDIEVSEWVVVVSGSSKQPHQPGVLHVSVLVRVDVAVLVARVEEVVVEDSVPLLSKNDQGKQSVQSAYCSHLAGSSYCSKTSLITLTIL
jgi:hypothetical protein